MRRRPEWIATHDDQAIPQWVYERLFDEAQGRCFVCSRSLRPGHWDADHVKRLRDGGAHRESNLRPVCRVPCHRGKTAEENRSGARASRMKARLHGYKKRKGRPMPGTKASGWKHKADGTWVRRDEE